MRFVLASESARRVDLLRMAGYDFEVRKSGFPEVVLDNPRETVEANARGKALAVASALPGEVVLAADTIVYLPGAGRVLGQAKDGEGVREMLGLIMGREHEVYSGVAIKDDEGIVVESLMTRVRISQLSGAEVEAYVASGEGIGKAGGYAIQGRAALFVERIEGDYTNVVGLPMNLTYRLLETFGVYWW